MINYDGQINLNANIRLIYMVFDLDKRYVLCYTGNISCAHAVADGILNSDIKSISYAKIKSALDEHKRFIIFKAEGKAYLETTNEEPDVATIDLIKLAELRLKYFTELNKRCLIFKEKYLNEWDATIHAYVNLALQKCDVNKDIFSDEIKEYAEIQEIDYKTAYKDLKMRFDSYSTFCFKSFAFFEKFKRLLNKCYTKEECIKLMEQLHIETEENEKN